MEQGIQCDLTATVRRDRRLATGPSQMSYMHSKLSRRQGEDERRRKRKEMEDGCRIDAAVVQGRQVPVQSLTLNGRLPYMVPSRVRAAGEWLM